MVDTIDVSSAEQQPRLRRSSEMRRIRHGKGEWSSHNRRRQKYGRIQGARERGYIRPLWGQAALPPRTKGKPSTLRRGCRTEPYNSPPFRESPQQATAASSASSGGAATPEANASLTHKKQYGDKEGLEKLPESALDRHLYNRYGRKTAHTKGLGSSSHKGHRAQGTRRQDLIQLRSNAQ
jgi:hypothetical protein